MACLYMSFLGLISSHATARQFVTFADAEAEQKTTEQDIALTKAFSRS